jgi:hypothetical protein
LEKRRERERDRSSARSAGIWLVFVTGSDPDCVLANWRPSPSKNADDDLVIRPGECERAPFRDGVVSIDDNLFNLGGPLPPDEYWREGISERCGCCEASTSPSDALPSRELCENEESWDCTRTRVTAPGVEVSSSSC